MSRPPLHIRVAHGLANVASRLGAIGSDLVGSIEHFFGGIGQRILDAFDSFDSLEGAIVSVVSAVLRPFLAVGRWLGRLAPDLSGKTGWLAWPVQMARRLIAGTARLMEALNLDHVVLFLVWLLKPLWWPIATLLGFLAAWIATRRPRETWRGAPALVLAAPFAYVAFAGALQTDGHVATRYKLAVGEAIAEGDHAAAQLYERKLAQLGVDTRRSDFRRAVERADRGDLRGAYQQMTRLAPVEKPGYAAAHGWMAKTLLENKLAADKKPLLEDPKERLPLVARHLAHLETLGASSGGLAMMRGYYLAQSGKLEQAAATLEPYAQQSFEAAGVRLRWLAAVPASADLRPQAQRHLQLFAEAAGRSRTQFDVVDHQTRAFAAQITNDVRQLEQAIAAWQQADPQSEAPQNMLAAVRRRQVETLLATETANPRRVAELLGEAARLGSPSAWLTQQVATISGRRAREHSARVMWEELLASPDTPKNLLLLVGTDAARRGRIVDARELFARLLGSTGNGTDDERASDDGAGGEIAREQGTPDDEGLASAYNNYAWTLIQEPDPDPDAALSAVQHALQLMPKDYRFRETRGQILLRLRRWPEAIEDLEFALNRMPNAAEIHRSLAIAYEALAKPQLAQMHREQAE